MRENPAKSNKNIKLSKALVLGCCLYAFMAIWQTAWPQSQAFTLSYQAVQGSVTSPYYLYVTASQLNIRSGPGTGYRQIGILQSGERVRVIEHTGSWRKIQRSSYTAYVSGKYLSLTPSPRQSSPIPYDQTQVIEHPEVVDTSKDLNVSDYHAYVTASSLNVRKGPGTNYDIYQSIPKNHEVKVTYHQGNWLRIEWENNQLAYVHGNYLKRKDIFEGVSDPEGLVAHSSVPAETTEQTSISANQSAPENLPALPSVLCEWQSPTSYIENYYVTATRTTAMRGQPHDQCADIGRYFVENTSGKVIAQKGDWVYLQNISTENYGWVHRSAFRSGNGGSRSFTGSRSSGSFERNDYPDFEPGFGPNSNKIIEAAAKMGVSIELPMRGRDVDREALASQIVPNINDAQELWFYYQALVDKPQPFQAANQQAVNEHLYWTPRAWAYQDDQLACIGWDACEAAWHFIRDSDYQNKSQQEQQRIAEQTREIAATYCLETDCSQEFFYRYLLTELQINLLDGQVDVSNLRGVRATQRTSIDLTVDIVPSRTTPTEPNRTTVNTDNNFYEPHAWRQNYDDFYSGRISSTTVPPYRAKNVHMAGERHPNTGIVYDQRGYPIFDDIAHYDTTLPTNEFYAVSYESQMRMATRDLRNTIVNNPRLRTRFRQDQLLAIYSGNKKIPDFTWHHHQDPGRMQLVPSGIHRRTGHIGGEAMREGQ